MYLNTRLLSKVMFLVHSFINRSKLIINSWSLLFIQTNLVFVRLSRRFFFMFKAKSCINQCDYSDHANLIPA